MCPLLKLRMLKKTFLLQKELRPGQYVRDVTKVVIPASFPPGRATLQLGLYRRNERMPVSGDPQVARPAERALHVATIEIE